MTWITYRYGAPITDAEAAQIVACLTRYNGAE
jgi:hypothetical protein